MVIESEMPLIKKRLVRKNVSVVQFVNNANMSTDGKVLSGLLLTVNKKKKKMENLFIHFFITLFNVGILQWLIPNKNQPKIKHKENEKKTKI